MKIDNARKFFSSKIKYILDSLDDALMPQVEISDMATLQHFVGQTVKIFDPKPGKSGRMFEGFVARCNDISATIVIGDVSVEIDNKQFDKGVRCYSMRN